MYKFLNDWRVQFIGTIIIIVTVLIYSSKLNEEHIKDINTVIQNDGGEVISIEDRVFDIGPFWYSKNTLIYKILYKDKYGVTQEAWVRYAAFDTDWVWDYNEELEKEVKNK